MSTERGPTSPTQRRRASNNRTTSISPRSGAFSAPFVTDRGTNLVYRASPGGNGRSVVASLAGESPTLPLIPQSSASSPSCSEVKPQSTRRSTFGKQTVLMENSRNNNGLPPSSPQSPSGRRLLHDTIAKAKSRDAQRVNDSMVYLDGPQVYTCAQCRTHLTSHDDIISKSFHGRHGRAYLFDQCVNVTNGTPEDRRLITGLHTVCDIFCKRCKTLVGWTYLKAHETSQKYKEGKFIIEKINLHLEESDYYDVAPPAGEKIDRWRKRSISWGSESGASAMVYEYQPSSSISEANSK